jgi:outer membrane protein TolC/LysM repeat protein
MNGKGCLNENTLNVGVHSSAKLFFEILFIFITLLLNWHYKKLTHCILVLAILLPVTLYAQYSHIVQPKESLYAIAKKYALNPLILAQNNDLDNNYNLQNGQIIFLTRKVSYLTYHTVRKGDNLQKIAKSYQYPLKKLAKINSLNSPYKLEKGQNIYFNAKHIPKLKKITQQTKKQQKIKVVKADKPSTITKTQQLIKKNTFLAKKNVALKKSNKKEYDKIMDELLEAEDILNENKKITTKVKQFSKINTDLLAPASTQQFVQLIGQAKNETLSGARFILGKKQLKVISLQDSLNMGLEQNLSIQQQQEQAQLAEHALSASKARLDPKLNLALTYSRSKQFARSEFFTREYQVQTDSYIVPDALDRFEQELQADFLQRLITNGISEEQAKIISDNVFSSLAWQDIYGADKDPVAGSFRFEVEQILRNEVFGGDPGLLTQGIFEQSITPAYNQFVQQIQTAEIFPDFYNESSFNQAYFGERNDGQRLDDSSSFLYDIEGSALSSAVVYDKTTVFDDEVEEIDGIEIPTIVIDNAIVGGDGNCIAKDGKVFIRNEQNDKWIAADPENDLAYIKSFCGYSRSNYRREEFASTDSKYVESYDLDLELEKSFWWGSQLKLNAATHKARPGYSLGNLYGRLSANSPFCSGDSDPSCLPGIFNWYSSLKLELNTPLPYAKNFGSEGNRMAVDIQLSESSLSAKKELIRQSNNTVLASISKAYWLLAKALGEIQIAQKQINILTEMKKKIIHQYQQYEVTEYNYNQVLASYENSLNQNELAWHNYLLASNQLAEQLNLAPELILIPDIREMHLQKAFLLPDSAEVIDYAMQFHPKRLVLQKQLFDKGLELRFYQNQNKPDLSLGLTQQYNQDSTVMGYNSFFESIGNLFRPDIKDFFIGINYSYPLGKRANKAAISKARLAKKQAQLALENNDLEIKVKIADSINNLDNTLQRFQFSSEQLQFAKESYEKVEQYNQQQQANDFERLQSLQTLLLAQQNYIENFIDRHLALNQLKAAKGEYACYKQNC